MFDFISFSSYKTSGLITPLNAYKTDIAKDVLKTIKVNEFSFSGLIKSFFVPKRHIINNAFNYMYGFHIFGCMPGTLSNMVVSNSYIILYFIKGEGILTYDGKTNKIKANSGIFISANEPFSISFNQSCEFYSLAINGEVLPYIYNEFYSDGDPFFTEALNGRLHTYVNELLEIYSSAREHRDLLASHMIETIAIYMLSIKQSQRVIDTNIPKSIKAAVRYMEDNYTHNLTLDKIAEHVILDKYHFAKEFKRYIGVSPKQYLIGIRLEQAKFLLENTTMPAAKIAVEVGFSDINNFYNQFKKNTNQTPSQYRELNKKL